MKDGAMAQLLRVSRDARQVVLVGVRGALRVGSSAAAGFERQNIDPASAAGVTDRHSGEVREANPVDVGWQLTNAEQRCHAPVNT